MFAKTLGDVKVDKLDYEEIRAECGNIINNFSSPNLSSMSVPIMFAEIYKAVSSSKYLYVDVIEGEKEAAYMQQELNRYSIKVTKELVYNKLLYKYVLLHEVGHIYFNHSSLQTYYELLKYIIEYYKQEKPEENLATIISRSHLVFIKLSNIAADLEINSKLFSPEEITNLCYLMADSYNALHIGCHPDFMDFPRQLTAKEYIDLMIRKMKDENIDPETLLNDIQAIIDTTTEANSESESRDDHNVISLSRDELLDVVLNRNKGTNKPNTADTDVLDIEPSKDIIKLAKQLFHQEYRLELHKDTLYNYNRGKLTYTLPRYRNSLKKTLSDIVFVVDVSTSMNSNLVKQFIRAIRDITTGLNHRIILFSHQILYDGKLEKVGNNFSHYGGTDLSLPLERLYLEKVNNKTKIVLLSDFQDFQDGNKYISYLNILPNVVCINMYPQEEKERIRKDLLKKSVKVIDYIY